MNHEHSMNAFGQMDTGRAGCAAAPHAQPGDRVHGMPTLAAYGVPNRPEVHAGTGDTPRAWAHDPRVHPWDHFWGYYFRWKRRPRCDGEG